MKTENESPVKDKHLLVALDTTDSSRRAVLYVADLLGGFPGFRVTLLSIIPEPEEDFFDGEADRVAWTKEHMAQANAMLERYRQILIQAGFEADKVRIRSCVGDAVTFSEAILDIRCDTACCTIVVGRHHKTKTEEFLFGSTSTRLIREAKNCAVWVVE